MQGQDGTDHRAKPQTHTPGHIDCPVCESLRLALHESLSPSLTFKAAFDLWLRHRTVDSSGAGADAGYLAPRTIRDYKACAVALERFFDGLVLEQIHADHLTEYQRARAVCDKAAGNWVKPAGANRIRKEIALLIRVLRAAQLWGEAQDLSFLPLRSVESDVPRVLSPEEQHRFLHMASTRVEWQFIYWYSIVALQTTASTDEMRALRMGDIFLRDRLMQIRRAGARKRFRTRTIPLGTPEVVWALEMLIARARELGAVAPSHYLFPIQRAKGSYDPTRPMSDSGLKKRWHAVRKAAELLWLRPHDLRHTALTRMAEAGTPIQVIVSMAGHMTLRMQEHYAAVSMAAKRDWVNATWSNGRARG